MILLTSGPMRSSTWWIYTVFVTSCSFASSATEVLATENAGVTVSSATGSSRPLGGAGNRYTSSPGISGIPSSNISGPSGPSRPSRPSGQIEAASKCNVASLSYRSALQQWQAQGARGIVTGSCLVRRTSFSIATIDTDIAVDWTTFCDGHPRTPSGFTYPTVTSWSTAVLTNCSAGIQASSTGTYTEAPPSCAIAPAECDQLYEASVLRTTGIPTTPACATGSAFQANCGDCTIFANGVQLFYWPVTTIGGDPCKGNGSTITASPSANGPNTVVFGNTTYTSPSGYLSFSDIFATVSNGAICGTPVSNFDVPIATFDLSSLSYSGIPPAYTSIVIFTESLNLADMNYPVPWSAYRGQPACANVSACATISHSYVPQIALPSWLTGLQNVWRTCKVHSTGVYDPPQALAPAATMAGPVLSTADGESSISTTSATPGNAMTSPGPSATGTLPPSTSARAQTDVSTCIAIAHTAGAHGPQCPDPTIEETLDPATQSLTDERTGTAPTSSGEVFSAGVPSVEASPTSPASSVATDPATATSLDLSQMLSAIQQLTTYPDRASGSTRPPKIVPPESSGPDGEIHTDEVASAIMSAIESLNEPNRKPLVPSNGASRTVESGRRNGGGDSTTSWSALTSSTESSDPLDHGQNSIIPSSKPTEAQSTALRHHPSLSTGMYTSSTSRNRSGRDWRVLLLASYSAIAAGFCILFPI